MSFDSPLRGLTAVVTGASGFLGSVWANELLHPRHGVSRVHLWLREHSKVPDEVLPLSKLSGVTIYRSRAGGDPTHCGIAQADVFLHCAARTKPGSDVEASRRENYELTKAASLPPARRRLASLSTPPQPMSWFTFQTARSLRKTFTRSQAKQPTTTTSLRRLRRWRLEVRLATAPASHNATVVVFILPHDAMQQQTYPPANSYSPTHANTTKMQILTTIVSTLLALAVALPAATANPARATYNPMYDNEADNKSFEISTQDRS
ncbi:hypothetical protein DFJ73DRAFT_755644 [Zopfochytrium polystomum]|nr:hypothetical protein DFJ73DRAFT_755644 [Zopfochytrium polystomum]